MFLSKQTGLILLLFGGICFAAQKPAKQPDPAELVRAIRQSEKWLNDFKTLYIAAERQWHKTPYELEKAKKEIQTEYKIENPDPNRFRDLLPVIYETVEIAIDKQRIRFFQLDPTYWRNETVWDGRQLTAHEKYFNVSQEFYCLDNTTERYFRELLPANFGWPRSQPHSPWWDTRNLESVMDFYGRPEDFKFRGTASFRSKNCYQLDYTVPEGNGLAFRWFVGTDDNLLYGIQTIRDGTKTLEHWWDAYKEVTPTGRFPMRLGWAFYEKKLLRKPQLTTECRVTVQEFKVNEPLDDALFSVELREGVEIQDHRFGQMREYTLSSKKDVLSSSETATDECRRIFSNPKAKTYKTASCFGESDRLSGRPMEGASLRVHEIELSFTPPFNTEAIPKANIRYGKLQFQDAGQTAFQCALQGDQSDRYGQTFYIDINHNGKWDTDETFTGREPTKGDKSKTWFDRVDIPLTNDQNQTYKHRVFAVYNHYDQLFVVSHIWKEATMQFGDETKNVFLVDYNCDGRYDSGKPLRDQQLFMEPFEASYDYIAWDENANDKLDYDEFRYFGSYSVYRGQVYQFAAKPDGSQIAVLPVTVSTGKLQLPVADAYVRLLGCKGPVAVGGFSEPVTLPADAYWVDYTVYYLPDGDNEPLRYAKSGRYYHKPWVIENGQTLTIPRELLDESAEDQRRYEEKVEAFHQQQEYARMEMLKKEYNSLIGETLDDFSAFGISEAVDQLKGSLLVCFWDFSQRPSRHAVSQLAGMKQMLVDNNVAVILIHTVLMDEQAKKWLAEKELPVHIGSITKGADQIRNKWGVQSLPWLILTDAEHNVVAEGFSIDELNDKLK